MNVIERREVIMSRLAKLIAVLALLVSLGEVYAATPITSCTTINNSGYYYLANNITTAGSTCIKITSSDVILEGQGHVIDGTGQQDSYGIFVNTSTTLRNITIKNVTLTDWKYDIYMENVQNAKISSIRIEKPSGSTYSGVFGIYIKNSENVSIIDSRIYDQSSTGVYILYSNRTTIANSRLNSNGDGIVVRLSNSTNILNNTITWSDYDGIYIYSSNYTTISNNYIDTFHDEGIEMYKTAYNKITSNTIGDNWGTGMDLRYINSSIIENNTVSDSSGGGIDLADSYSNVIANNTVEYNGDYGISIFGSRNDIIFNNTVRLSGYTNVIVYDAVNLTVSHNSIEGNGDGILIRIGSSDRNTNVTITHNTIDSYSSNGIDVSQIFDGEISNNIVSADDVGMEIFDSQNVEITSNTVDASGETVRLRDSINITLRDNLLTGGIVKVGYYKPEYWNTHTFANNSLNGKPVIYYANVSGMSISNQEAGEYIFANCTNAAVRSVNTSAILLGYSDNVEVSNSRVGYLYAVSSDYINVSGNIFANVSTAVEFKRSNNGSIVGNTISCESNWNTYGIDIYSGQNHTISGNSIEYCEEGIGFSTTRENRVENNVISNTKRAIDLFGSDNNTITGNTITNNSIGIKLYWDSHRTYENSENNTIFNNYFNNTENVYVDRDDPYSVEVPEGSFKWTTVDPSTAANVTDGAVLTDHGNYTISAYNAYFVYKLPFVFPFLGRSIVNISVNTNGLIELLEAGETPYIGSGYGTHYNDWNYLNKIDAIFASNDNLETVDGYMGVFNLGDRVVVEWYGSTIRDGNSSNYPLHFQVVLYPNGTVEWNFKKMNFSAYYYDMFSGAYAKEENVEFVVGYAVNYTTSFSADLSTMPYMKMNSWNVTKTRGTNIIGGSYLGGNYWALPNGTGFSENCNDGDGDGICDSAFIIDPANIDYLPLAVPGAPPADTTPPGITFVSPTPANGSVLNATSATINVTANERLANATLKIQAWNGSSWGWFTNNTFKAGAVGSYQMYRVTDYNWLGLISNTSTDLYLRYKVEAEDLAGNVNRTEFRYLTIAGYPPQVYASLGYVSYVPQYSTLLNKLYVFISEGSPDKLEIYRNGTLYKTLSYHGFEGFTVSIDSSQAGVWNYTLVASDTFGNVNSTSLLIPVTPAEASIEKNITGQKITINETLFNTSTTFEILPEANAGVLRLNVSASTNVSELESSTSNEEFVYALGTGQVPIGKFIKVEVGGDVNAGSLQYAVVAVAYTPEDLDTDGDGSADINESTLTLWRYCSEEDKWIELRHGTNYNVTCGNLTITVFASDVNTSERYVYASLSHLSVFGVSGEVIKAAPTVVTAAPAAGGAYSPEAVLLANSIDLALAQELVAHLKERGIKLYITDATNFTDYSTKQYIVILGGHKAYEGVGDIVADILSEEEKAQIEAGKAYIKKRSVFRKGDVVYIFAGKDRNATREAWQEAYEEVAREIAYNWG